MCFALWLGAAALACGTFTPLQLAPEHDPPTGGATIVVARGEQPELAVDAGALQLAAARASLTQTAAMLAKP